MSYQCVKCGKEIISVNQEERAHDPAILRAGIRELDKAIYLSPMGLEVMDKLRDLCTKLLAGEPIEGMENRE